VRGRIGPAVVTVKALTPDGVRTGSGFLVSNDGLIATSKSLVQDAADILIIFANDKRGTAKVAKAHPAADLVILKTRSPGITSVPLGDPDMQRAEQPVVACAHPNCRAGLYSSGTHVEVRQLGGADYVAFRGNTPAEAKGGPLVGEDGRVIGVLGSRSNRGTNLAVAITEVKNLLPLIR
jgi:S1-C subfamily serine protease